MDEELVDSISAAEQEDQERSASSEDHNDRDVLSPVRAIEKTWGPIMLTEPHSRTRLHSTQVEPSNDLRFTAEPAAAMTRSSSVAKSIPTEHRSV